jgi:hypothetical protein
VWFRGIWVHLKKLILSQIRSRKCLYENYFYMKSIHIAVLVSVSLLKVISLQAQWEQIGWSGGSIKIQAQLGNTLFGVGDNYPYISTIYRSTDWGKTWKMYRDGLPLCTYENQNIWVSVSGDYIYLGLTNDVTPSIVDRIGMYYSKEKDSVWTHLRFSPIENIAPYHNVFSSQPMLFSNDTILCYFGGVDSSPYDSSSGFYLSTDLGKYWKKTFDPTAGALPYFAHHRVYTFVSSFDSLRTIPRKGILYSSNDAGLSWTKLSYPGPEGDLYPYFLDDTLLFFVIHASQPPYATFLYRSLDGGNKWEQLSIPYPGIGPFFERDNRVFLHVGLTNPNRDLQYISEDKGLTWNRYTFFDSSSYIGNIFGGSGHYILKMNYDGFMECDTTLMNPKPYENFSGLQNYNGSLNYVSGDTLYATNYKEPGSSFTTDSLSVSYDNGTTWTRKLFCDHHYSGKARWTKSGAELYAAGGEKDTFNFSIFKSEDNGSSWKILTPLTDVMGNTSQDIHQIFASHDTLLVVFDGGTLIYYSTNDGVSWSILSPPSAQFFSQSFQIGYYNGKIFYFPKFSIDNFFYTSSNLGTSWVPKELPTFNNNHDFLQPYFFGNELLFSATTESPDPFRFQFFIGNANGESIIADPNIVNDTIPILPLVDENGILYASGTSDGQGEAFYSIDDGSHWTQLPNHVPDVSNLFIGSNYIFTSGTSELWRFPKSSLTLKAKEMKNPLFFLACFPNPATTSTRISYSIPQHSNVLIEAFDVMGRSVARIANSPRDAGTYEAVWDTNLLPAGSYIIRLTAGGEILSKVVEVVR